jgi:hypothetical protein
VLLFKRTASEGPARLAKVGVSHCVSR